MGLGPDYENPWESLEVMNRQLARYRAQQEAEEARRQAAARHADAVMSNLHEEIEGLAFAAGLTCDQYHAVFEQYGQAACEIIQMLIDGKAGSVDDARQKLMAQAGDEAGQLLVDSFRQALQTRFSNPQSPEELFRAEDRQWNREHRPKRRKQWGKERVQEQYRRWQERQAQQRQDDADFEDLITNWQSEQTKT